MSAEGPRRSLGIITKGSYDLERIEAQPRMNTT